MASFLDGHGRYCTCTRDKCTYDCATYRRFNPKPITNADRIRAMTDEELEVWLVNLCCATVGDAASARVQILRGNLLEWLKQESKE